MRFLASAASYQINCCFGSGRAFEQSRSISLMQRYDKILHFQRDGFIESTPE